MSELWCQHALGCKTQRASGRGCAALRIWRCSPAPADRRGAPGARARPHTSRGRPRRLGRARRRSGVRSRPSRARKRHDDKNLYFMTTSGTAAARPSCAVTHFILYRASSAVRLSVAFFPLCLSLRSSPFPLLYRAKVCFMTTGGTAAACRARAATQTFACIRAVRRAPLRRAPSQFCLSDVNCCYLNV